MTPVQAWLRAFRLRTLPLAFSSIVLGAFLAAYEGHFSAPILVWALLTTLFLQILSNLANDYGDFVKGTDNDQRIGPERTMQAGLIRPKTMKIALVVFSVLALASGVSLLYTAGAFSNLKMFWFFLGLGLFCILAAITYTIGKNAYGYKGMGDISVLVFFGLIGVLGTHYLMVQHFSTHNILLAISSGLLATGVLNLNNLRDIENDKASGKNSIPVKIGFEAGKKYHTLLISISLLLIVTFCLVYLNGWSRIVFLPLVPIYFWHLYQVTKTKQQKEMDKFLKQLALTSLLTTFVIGIGMIY